jgi:hypothetical protein
VIWVNLTVLFKRALIWIVGWIGRYRPVVDSPDSSHEVLDVLLLVDQVWRGLPKVELSPDRPCCGVGEVEV